MTTRGWDSGRYDDSIREERRYCDWCGVKLAPTSQITQLVRQGGTLQGSFPTAWRVSSLDSPERICGGCSRLLKAFINRREDLRLLRGSRPWR